jgi:hypothetical protein
MSHTSTKLLEHFKTLSPLMQEAVLSDLVFNYSTAGSWYDNAAEYDGDIEAVARDIFGEEFGTIASEDILRRI